MNVITYATRDEWQAARRGPDYPIGASEIAAIMLGAAPPDERADVPDWIDAFDLWRSHKDPTYRREQRPEMADGLRWEEIAISVYRNEVGGAFVVAAGGMSVWHHDCGWLRATPDAVVSQHDEELVGLAEIKTDRSEGASSAWPAHGTEIRDWPDDEPAPVPLWYWLQVQAQIACTGAAWVDLIVWIPVPWSMPERRTIRVHPSVRWPAILASIESWRARYLLGDEIPTPHTPEQRMALLRMSYPERTAERPATEAEAAMIARHADLTRQSDAIGSERQELRADIVESMGAMRRIWCDGGSASVSARGVLTIKGK